MNSNPLRKEPRTSAVMPVRIYGMDATGKPFNTLVHTLNISMSGGLLANVDVPLNQGDVIGVQKGVYKSKFRVQWVGKKGSAAQGQLGIECVDGPKNIWGVEARPVSQGREAEEAQRRSFAGGGSVRERRAAPRHPCDIGIQIRQDGSEVNLWSRCTDLSEGGCYIDSRSPLAPGTKVNATLFIEPEHLTTPIIVRTSFAGMGMGVQFLFQSEDQAVILRRYLRQKFGEAEEIRAKAHGAALPALDKLAESIEQLRAWVEATALNDNDREEVETVAISLRRELLGLRDEINQRVMERNTEKLVSGTSA